MSGDASSTRPWRSRVPWRLPAIVVVVSLLAWGCGAGPGSEGGDGREEPAAESTRVDDRPPASETAESVMGSVREGKPAVAESVAPSEVPPSEEGTDDAGLDRADSGWIRTASAHPDTALAGRFFVRLVPSADPEEVARAHEIAPIEVLTGEVKIFYAELTWGQVSALARDASVRSLAQEIEGGDQERPPVRGIETGGDR